MNSINGNIACRPAKPQARVAAKGPLVAHSAKTDLYCLDVLVDASLLFGNEVEMLDAGSKVWVRAEQYLIDYGKQQYTIPEIPEPFVLVPQHHVVFFCEE